MKTLDILDGTEMKKIAISDLYKPRENYMQIRECQIQFAYTSITNKNKEAQVRLVNADTEKTFSSIKLNVQYSNQYEIIRNMKQDHGVL